MLAKAVLAVAAMAFAWGAFASRASAADPASAPAATPAASPSGPLPLDAFFSKPVITGAQISPDGRNLVMIRRYNGQPILVVYDLQTNTTKVIASNSDKSLNIDWVRWKGPNRIVAGLTYLKIVREGGRADGAIISIKYSKFIIAVDRDGKNLIELFKSDKHTAGRTGAIMLFLDGLRNDPDHILAVASLESGQPAVWRANIQTGAAEIVERADTDTAGWDTDRDGNVVARFEEIGRNMLLQGRAPGETKWTDIIRIRPKDLKELSDFEFLGPTPLPAQLYVAVKPENPSQGTARAIRVYDFRTRSLGPPVWPALKYDVSSIVSPPGSNDLQGVCYWVDTYHCDFKNPDMQANFIGMERFFHGDRSISPVSFSDDGRWWLLDVSGPNEPSTYYLYDWKKKTMENLVARFPDLPTERLGVMERFVYQARDGTSIPGYVTRPPGAPAGPLPLVVLPHGGPEARDDFDFDTWAQFIATRGYVVFQPNFRGSAGYGVAYAEAGYGQWGDRMQDDILDGIKKLIDSGQVDPKRICIFGASYGGYAALIQGARNPDLYKCVISWAGISDLNRMVRTEKGGILMGERSPAYEYDVRAVGDLDKDKDRMARTSAVTYAAHYGPPVLLIHGTADTNVPVEQSKIMEHALKQAGRPVRLITYSGEDHNGWSDEHEKAALTEVATFLAAHIPPAMLTPPAPTTPAAPAPVPAPTAHTP